MTPVWARPPRAWTLLAEKTGIPSDTLYGYLKGFLRLGVIKRTKEGRAYCYSFNYILWPELIDFVAALVEYQMARLVPREALLIKDYGDRCFSRASGHRHCCRRISMARIDRNSPPGNMNFLQKTPALDVLAAVLIHDGSRSLLLTQSNIGLNPNWCFREVLLLHIYCICVGQILAYCLWKISIQ